ncbi:HU family DNA-binding protein [Chroococcidiopsis sp. CCMEE 29]|uniref:HU family DNA-binding protein n=1 Tax=Chroococcidiopsis sp. CCMEE 29 TaxID=155894 RepID=UPI0020221278|nr:HU family DNA-binding protein [Chroococcidiopsis sp. CCMEE 29]
MNKTELIAAVAAKAQVNQNQANAILSATLDTIVESVAAGEKVVLIGFGSFEAKQRQAREARNPRTGETMTVAATQVPTFSAGKVFKQKVKPTA